MLENYFPVFVFILIGIVFGIAPVITGLVVATLWKFESSPGHHPIASPLFLADVVKLVDTLS